MPKRILLGLDEYEPQGSPRAILRARHPDVDVDNEQSGGGTS
ncbi:MAG TPA: hypothetical protein VFE42_35050 [Chloroflexota bacterium]|nr:hypothetical protein [Chloroflexota bacterium]